jgi:hypothetical protein
VEVVEAVGVIAGVEEAGVIAGVEEAGVAVVGTAALTGVCQRQPRVTNQRGLAADSAAEAASLAEEEQRIRSHRDHGPSGM